MKLFAHVSKKTLIIYIVAILSLVATACILPFLPSVIQTSVQGEGATRPSWFLLITALLPFVSTILFSFIPFETDEGAPKMRPFYYQAMMWILALILIGFQWILVGNALGISFSVETICQFLIGIAMIAVGVYLRPLPFGHPGAAIKLVWVTEDEYVWNKTHKMSGWLFMGTGLVTLLSIVLVHLPFVNLSYSIPTIVLLVSLMASSLIILWASLRCYKQFHKDDPQPEDKKGAE